MITRRSLICYSLLFAFLLLILTTHRLSPNASPQRNKFNPVQTSDHTNVKPSQKKPLRVYITETGSIHDEVVAAFAHAFGSQPNTNVTLFQTRPRYGMSDIISNFSLPHPMNGPLKPEEFNKSEVPDIVISTTCGLDMRSYLKAEFDYLRDLKRTYVICAFHHADHWNEMKWSDKYRPWLKNGLLSFLFLSPHVVDYFRDQGTTNWDPTVRAQAQQNLKTLTPVFPVNLDPLPSDVSQSKNKHHASSDIVFALQGNYDAKRRDFDSVFSDLQSLIHPTPATHGNISQPLLSDQKTKKQPANQKARSRTMQLLKQKKQRRQDTKKAITLQFLGHGGHPTVPASIQDSVEFHDKLPYHFYYKRLSHATAILPAFASDGYLDTKASSSIPASLIAGVPVIAPKNLTDAYSYLGKGNVYAVKEGQVEVNVMRRIVKMKAEERLQMKRRVRVRRDEVIAQNVEIVGQWVGEIEERLRKVEVKSRKKKGKGKDRRNRRRVDAALMAENQEGA